MRTSALESAAQQSEILDQVNKFYTSNVVDRLQIKDLEVTHDYLTKKNAIPLPATLTIELGRLISERNKEGVQVRLYSDHPFRTRTDGGPKDDFEQQALTWFQDQPAEWFKEKPREPYYRFEDVQGRPSLRYATAQLMQDSCVQCHNGHADSSKKDWKVGEVVGVLEIIRPLDRDTTRAREGLHFTLIVMAAISGSLVGLSILVLFVANRRREGRERTERENG